RDFGEDEVAGAAGVVRGAADREGAGAAEGDAEAEGAVNPHDGHHRGRGQGRARGPAGGEGRLAAADGPGAGGDAAQEAETVVPIEVPRDSPDTATVPLAS